MSGTFLPARSKTCVMAADRSFRVERVENCFHREQIDAAFKQCRCLPGISAFDLIERDGAKTGIVNVRRK